MGMVVFYLAVLLFGVFVVGVWRDPRSFGNAVLLGLCLALGALGAVGAAHQLPGAPGDLARILVVALGLFVALGPFLVASYLVLNGITMARRESIRPGNLLSLLAGLGMFALFGLMVIDVLVVANDRASYTAMDALNAFTIVVVMLSGYISFLLVSYVSYAFVYGRVTALRGADFVVVLGSGLIGGDRVPPLLASRLDRGRRVYQALVARGKSSPMLIVSGGKGADERVSEAEAMAGYLIERGVPADSVLREDQSRSTEENLTFSKGIMERFRPRYRCIVVTSNYHVFRTAILTRRLGVNGQVTGARTAGYYWPSAMLREFVAVFLGYKAVNLGICALIVVLPLAYFGVEILRGHW
jgi:uncharacterized SAM-binding protein YcdF (DUF218 family)